MQPVCSPKLESRKRRVHNSGSPMPVLTQTDERTVRGEGFSVTIADEHTVRYDEPGRSLNFEISLQCCGGIQFVMHTLPSPDRWDRAPGEERITIDEDEYQ